MRVGEDSGLRRAVSRIGDRWTLLIVDALLGGERRFGELASVLPGLAPNILSARLKQLEEHHLVVAEPYSHRPLRVAYRLTAAGHDLADALRVLSSWGARTGGDTDLHVPSHGACRTALEVRWWCPTCAEPVEPDDTDLEWV
jgi:DNA-binding HxlR family transcriptional regulator